MTDLIRDTAFGHFLRVVSGKRMLLWEEEKNPELWKKFVDEEKSGFMAHHGNTQPPGEDDPPMETIGGVRTREGIHKEAGAQGSLKKYNKTKEDRSPSEQSDSSADTKVVEATDSNAVYNEASGVKVDPEKGRDALVVGWWGDNDPENPMNWSHAKKFFVTGQICLLTFSVYIGSAIYSAGIETVMEDFGVSQVAATLGLTLFVAGYGLGPMIWSPMSEIPAFGRNPIYLITLFLFVLLQLPTVFAVNFGMLLAFRFITGFIGSPCLATGGASIGDMYRPSKRAYGIGIWGISAVMGPVMGPLVGGWAAQFRGWTWTIWELMWLSGFCFVVLFFFLPETSSTNILYRRTQRLRKLTGNEKLTCEPMLMSEHMTAYDVAMMTLVKPITLNFLEPMVFLLNLYIALIYGLLYIWFESFPIVFTGIYGFSLGFEGLAFIGILVGGIIVIPPFFWYLHKYTEPQFNANGELQPEKRLPPAFVGAFAIPICLFWFGWSARPDVHWIVPIIGSGWFTIGAFLLFNSVLNYLPDAYPNEAASVLAGNDLFRSSFGAGFPLFASAMYKNLGVGWASSTLAFLSIAFIPIPFLLYKYGETLRQKHSKYARKDF